MKTNKFNEKQRLAILAEQDQGKTVTEICKAHQISPHFALFALARGGVKTLRYKARKYKF